MLTAVEMQLVSDMVFYKRPVNVMIESVGRLSFATRWTWPLSEAMPERRIISFQSCKKTGILQVYYIRKKACVPVFLLVIYHDISRGNKFTDHIFFKV